jgi:hypothetical protein
MGVQDGVILNMGFLCGWFDPVKLQVYCKFNRRMKKYVHLFHTPLMYFAK